MQDSIQRYNYPNAIRPISISDLIKHVKHDDDGDGDGKGGDSIYSINTISMGVYWC